MEHITGPPTSSSSSCSTSSYFLFEEAEEVGGLYDGDLLEMMQMEMGMVRGARQGVKRGVARAQRINKVHMLVFGQWVAWIVVAAFLVFLSLY